MKFQTQQIGRPIQGSLEWRIHILQVKLDAFSIAMEIMDMVGTLTEEVKEKAVRARGGESDAGAVGPGLGRRPETAEFLVGLAGRVDQPLIIDADGLAAFENSLELLKDRSAPTVLTPHPGEAARLLGSGAEEVNRDRVLSLIHI